MGFDAWGRRLDMSWGEIADKKKQDASAPKAAPLPAVVKQDYTPRTLTDKRAYAKAAADRKEARIERARVASTSVSTAATPKTASEHASVAAAHAEVSSKASDAGMPRTASTHAALAEAHAAMATPTKVLGTTSVSGASASGGHADPKSSGTDDRKRDDHGRFA